jgi:hypothetical protein
MNQRRSRHARMTSPTSWASLHPVSWMTRRHARLMGRGVGFEVLLCREPRVYVMTYGDAVKFGMSNDPQGRAADVRRDVERSPTLEAVRVAAGSTPTFDLRFVGYGGAGLEAAVHRYLMPDHLAGEWFAISHRARRAVQYLVRLGFLVYPNPRGIGYPGVVGRHPVEAIARLNAEYRGIAETRS